MKLKLRISVQLGKTLEFRLGFQFFLLSSRDGRDEGKVYSLALVVNQVLILSEQYDAVHFGNRVLKGTLVFRFGPRSWYFRLALAGCYFRLAKAEQKV